LNERKKNNDIVFVIDHSGSMENIKKELAINGILKIFDNYL
jgi:Mg-chelatase subunit ChlD